MFNFLKDFGVPGVLVGAMTFLAIAFKQYVTINEKRIRTTKSQLDLLIDVMGDEKKRNNKFIVEQAFSYKFKSSIPHSVIDILLDTANPTTLINDYIKGRVYLTTCKNSTNLAYKSRVSKEKDRTKWKKIYATCYFVFALPGSILLAWVPSIYKRAGIETMTMPLFLALALLVWAYYFIDFYKSLNAAERIMEQVEQQPQLQSDEGGRRLRSA